MSAPKILIQIVITGTQIFGKALYAAGVQAIKNARYAPQAISSDVTGVNNATTGSLTDRLTREHRLTLDEAHLILNSKREDSLEHVIERYDHLFKVNIPPKSTSVADSRLQHTFHSHYLQSKIVRARERIEAEHKQQQQQQQQQQQEDGPSHPPPSNPTSPPAP